MRQGKRKQGWNRSRKWRRGKGSKSEAGTGPGGGDEAREAKVKLGQVVLPLAQLRAEEPRS